MASSGKLRAGWFNIVGLFALTAGSGFLTAGLIEDIWNTAVNCNLTNADDFLFYSSKSARTCAFSLSITCSGVGC